MDWYRRETEAVLSELSTTDRGLTQSEARERLARFGPNKLAEVEKISLLKLLLNQFKSPLIYILLIAGVVTFALEEYKDTGVIAAVLFLNALIGFIQEFKAEKQVQALKKMVVARARVLRDGNEMEVNGEEVVPGDIVLLASGGRVPADIRLFKTIEFKADESMLTGESIPAEKTSEPIPEENLTPGDQLNMAFMGTVVVNGRARGVVVATGDRTVLGHIARDVQEIRVTRSPLQEKIDRFAQAIGIIVLVAATLLFLVGILVGEEVTDMFMTAVAATVATIPEGLPIVVTIALAIGVARMAQRNAVVRKLPAVETLGSTTVICSDKTGTLTKNEMTVKQIFDGQRTFELTGTGYDPEGEVLEEGRPVKAAADPQLTMLFRIGLLCNESHVLEEEGVYRVDGDPTEGALIVAAMKAGLSLEKEKDALPQLAIIPFESDRGYMATLHRHGERNLVFVKGAPEKLMELCVECRAGAWGGVHNVAEQFARDGLRVLGMAYKETPAEQTDMLLDRGAGLATLSSIQRRTAKLLEEVRGLVSSLSGLAVNRYQELLQVFDRVAQDLAPLMAHRRAVMEGPLTLPFPDLGPQHLLLAGAKSVNLARVRNELGLPAPDGFVVTTAAFDLFLRENRLFDSIDAMLGEFDPDAAQSWEACLRIQEGIREAPLPRDLADALDREYMSLSSRHGGMPQVAMRSSAVGEDTEASFAGQYTSVLDLERERIAAAYQTVLASKYTPRAIIYRLRYGLTDAATPMAVAAVVMIRARASGVLYTVDPSRPASGRARIDAAAGLGEKVVGGSASPDVFHVDRSSLQIVGCRIEAGEAPHDGGDPGAVISDQAVLSLVESGVRMEGHFGAPQDIEWAEDEGGNLFFLQTRPLGMAAGDDEQHPPDVSGLELLLSAGQTASPGQVSGKAVQARPDLQPEAAEGAILISRTAAPDLAPFMGRVRGLITDLGGAASHLASVAREVNVPALMDTREATMLIADGQEITLLADEGKVYLGLVPELARKLPDRSGDDERGPIGRHLREVLDRISPLNLTDPKAPNFTPGGCRTLHDLIRFAHEKAMVEMFSLSDLADSSVVSRKLSANIPLSLYFIDLGGGLAPGLTSCDEIRPEHIQSRPMAALWRGLTHPGITWSGAVDISARNFMALMAGSIGPENATPPEVDSYALISRDYLNLSVKFGYHYSNLDALCSDDPDANTVAIQFSGGAGTGMGKALRIELLSRVLSRLGYDVEVTGDILQAALKGLDCPAMEDLLDQTGRLLGCSRLLDLAIPSQAEVHTLTELFFKGDYDFLGRSEARLPGYYASVGEWSRAEFEGQEMIVQDGSGMTGTVSCSLHSVLDTVLGGRYRRFLENRHALHYYPVAVARDSRLHSGRARVDVRIRAGCVDLAAGLAFGLMNVGNSLVLAADASAGELQLLEFVNNTRHFRERTAMEIPMDRWMRLEVTVDGREVTGALDGRPCLRFTASHPVEGYVGLWSKGDTTAFYRDLEMEFIGSAPNEWHPQREQPAPNRG